MFPKRLLAIGLFAAAVFMHAGVSRAQWVQTNGPNGGKVSSFATIGDTVFAGTNGGVFLSTDSGASWRIIPGGIESPTGRQVNCIAASKNTIVAGTSDRVFLSKDEGATWSIIDSIPGGGSNAIAIRDSTIWADNFNGLYLSDDLGKTWKTIAVPNSGALAAKALALVDQRLLVGGEGGILLTTNSGASWKQMDSMYMVANFALQGATVLAGEYEAIWRSTDSGATWRSMRPSAFKFESISALASVYSTIIASAFSNDEYDRNGIFVSHNNGITWDSASIGISQYNEIHALLFIAHTLLAGTDYGVFISHDSGRTWSPSNAGMSATAVKQLASIESNLFAVTDDGVFLTTDYGSNWASRDSNLESTYVNSLAGQDSVLYAGTGNSVYRSLNTGKFWEHCPPNDSGGGHIVNTVYTFGNTLLADVLYSTDGGASWHYGDRWPAGDAADEFYNFTALGNKIFAGTLESAYSSSDSGRTWVPEHNGLPLDSSQDGVVYDGCHSVVSLTTLGSNLFAVTGCYGIFCSKDSGGSWVAANQGLPLSGTINSGISASCITNDGSNLFAGTFDSGIYMSADSGLIWFPVNQGLSSLRIAALAVQSGYLFAGTLGNGVCWRRPLSEMTAPRSSVLTRQATNVSHSSVFPNPSSGPVQIEFTALPAAYADVRIVNLLGAEVAHLYSGELAAGKHSFLWSNPTGLPAGMYECVVRMDGIVEHAPILLEP